MKLTFPLIVLLVAIAAAPARGAASGDISPKLLEIDDSANLYLDDLSGDYVDWVKDSGTNSDPPSLINGIATGLIRTATALNPIVTSAPLGTGHWNGVRIVDGIAGGDKNIFLTGGKENDVSTWNVGPGSVGSSKYDITQAYLANNTTTLYFGMERRGNNGTTAFDFEFNKLAPAPPISPATASYIPNRSVGDVLFTFEMQGSGTSGSAVPHFFIWDGSTFVEDTTPPPSLVATINQAVVPAAPWGYVTSKGVWALGSLPRFSFAEASVLLSAAFPGIEPCGTSFFVQVRTRSSSTENSDLKDTTPIFEFRFGGPDALPTYGFSCDPEFTFDGTASVNAQGGTTGLTYAWEFKPDDPDVDLTGVGSADANGVYHSTASTGTVGVVGITGASTTVKAKLRVTQGTTCSDESSVQTLTILPLLVATITDKESDGADLEVVVTGEALTATSLQWQRLSGATWVNISGATSDTLTYSGFESHDTPEVKDFTIDSNTNYQGKLYEVQLRLHAERLVGGILCKDDSDPVTVLKVIAVDP
jgi:hypothetical protein